MASLIRTKQGNFTLENAYTLEDIKNNNYKLLKVEDIFTYPRLDLDKENAKKVLNGASIYNKNNYTDKVLCFYENKCLAIYKSNDKYLKSYIQL